MPLDLSQIRVIIIGPQGSGKTLVKQKLEEQFNGVFPVNTLQTPKVDGESIVIRAGWDNQVETFFLNPTGPMEDI